VSARLPTHLEVTGLIRAVEAEGGFAAVLSKGERDAGTILLVLTRLGAEAVAYERLPQVDGSRKWTQTRRQEADEPTQFSDYLARRSSQDPDLWVVEIDVRDPAGFAARLNDG